jgi:hypothetical protein
MEVTGFATGRPGKGAVERLPALFVVQLSAALSIACIEEALGAAIA